MGKKLTIEKFWWFHNTDCWKIKRKSMVDRYLYLSTMKYIYQGNSGKWYGTKYHKPQFLLTKKQQRKTKQFKNETAAVKWLAKVK